MQQTTNFNKRILAYRSTAISAAQTCLIT